MIEFQTYNCITLVLVDFKFISSENLDPENSTYIRALYDNCRLIEARVFLF